MKSIVERNKTKNKGKVVLLGMGMCDSLLKKLGNDLGEEVVSNDDLNFSFEEEEEQVVCKNCGSSEMEFQEQEGNEKRLMCMSCGEYVTTLKAEK